jgi:predicted TIM-barrel fold metal-dependent hydrolase
MRIFANHAHLMPPEAWPGAGVEDLLRLMEACGIERAVCFAPFADQARPAGIADPNRWLAEQIEGRPELIGFACLNPTLPESLAALPRLGELGLRGVKLHPAYNRFDVADPQAREFYAAASAQGWPLDFHTGVHASRLRHWEMNKFDDVAWDVPECRLILEHVGGVPFFYQALAVIGNHLGSAPVRVFAGMTTLLNPAIPLWYLGEERIERLAAMVGSRALIYGLDFPYNTVEVVQRELEIYRSANLGPGGQQALLGGNLAELLGES